MIAGATFFGVAGCGSGRSDLYSVKGSVFYKGKPAAGAVVFFQSTVGPGKLTKDSAVERPYGQVQENGSFEISTFGRKDGAPVGQYRVSVVWLKNTGKGENETESLLPPELMNPNTSGLPIVNVRAERNELPPFQLGE